MIDPKDDRVVSPYSFENDRSGKLFCWLIESGQFDYRTLIETALRGESEPRACVEKLAAQLKARIGQKWAAPPAPPPKAERIEPSTSIAYTLWFRPSPSTRIKFKEVARALLIFVGAISPSADVNIF